MDYLNLKLLQTTQPIPKPRRLAIDLTEQGYSQVRQRNPWVYAQYIKHQNHEGQLGDLAIIFDKFGKFFGAGLYDPSEDMRIKVLHMGRTYPIDATFFEDKVRAAIAIREPLKETNTTGYRVIHGENDGLPSFNVDVYGDVAVIKVYSGIWIPYMEMIVKPLIEMLNLRSVVLRVSRHLKVVYEAYGWKDGHELWGEPLEGNVTFLENGLPFTANVKLGHKTGFFCDHRDNRALVRPFAEGVDVLDVFSYVGGFAVYAAAAGARSVTSIDVNHEALIAAKANVSAVRPDCPYELMKGDALTMMKELITQGRKFGLIIIDPPSFAKEQKEVERALTSYYLMAREAARLIDEGGFLFMGSCSSRISAELFYGAVRMGLADGGLQWLDPQYTGHGIDHPIRIYQSFYLKSIFGPVVPITNASVPPDEPEPVHITEPEEETT